MPNQMLEINNLINFPQSLAFSCLSLAEVGTWRPSKAELKCICNVSSARRIESFTLGRLAAHRALNLLEPDRSGDFDQFDLIIGSNRHPIWPTHIVGSIAHSADLACSIVSRQKDFLSVGIDIEVLDRPRSIAIADRIAHESEKVWIMENKELAQQRMLQLFSAKECVYKAFYPICRRYFGFSAVELSPIKAGFEGRIVESLGDQLPVGFNFNVSSAVAGNVVLSALWLPNKG